MLDKFPTLPAPFDRLDISERHIVRTQSGGFVFHQGATAHSMYFLQKGKIRLVRHTESGQPVTLFQASPGDFVAEASLFTPNYHCDCVADRNSVLVRLEKPDCLDALSSNPEFSLIYIERLSKQLQLYRRRIELMSIKPAKDRVWAAFCDGWLGENITEFASTLDLTPEATYRALGLLVKDGLITKSGYGRYTPNRA